MICAPSKDSDQPGHPASLIRDTQADLSLRWVHMPFVGFVMRQLKDIEKAGAFLKITPILKPKLGVKQFATTRGCQGHPPPPCTGLYGSSKNA